MVTLCSFLLVSIDYVFKQNFFTYLYFLSVGILTVLGKNISLRTAYVSCHVVVGMAGEQVQVFVVADHNTCVSIDSFQAFNVMNFYILTLLSYEL